MHTGPAGWWTASRAHTGRNLRPPTARSITLIGAGLSDTSSALKASFRRTLATLASEAWVGAYANAWQEALAREGQLTSDASRAAERGPGLPDWLHAAAIHLLANPSAERQAELVMRKNIASAMPLAELFRYRIPAESDGVLEDLLGESDDSGSSGSEAADVAPQTRTATLMFLAQSTSVLEYLRTTRGTGVSRALVVPLLAGWNVSDLLTNDDAATTLERLDADWREWVITGKTRLSRSH